MFYTCIAVSQISKHTCANAKATEPTNKNSFISSLEHKSDLDTFITSLFPHPALPIRKLVREKNNAQRLRAHKNSSHIIRCFRAVSAAFTCNMADKTEANAMALLLCPFPAAN